MDKDPDFHSFQRINVIGTSGSGKSTFSRKLAAIIGAPYLEIDHMFWGPDWTNLDDPEFFAKMEQQLDRDTWVLDGNYTKTAHIKWRHVQTIIWLDYSRYTIMSRAIRRAIWRIITQVELWQGTGNRESLRQLFSKDSIVRWSWNTYQSNRDRYNQLMTDSDYAHIRFIRLSDPREAEKFLNSIRIKGIR